MAQPANATKQALCLIHIFCSLFLIGMAPVLTSCSDDGSQTQVSGDYCYIKSVTLGTIKRKTNTLNTSFVGSSFQMTVDHRTCTIENRDSLPYGSQLERVIATITFDGSSLAYRQLGTEAWTSYSATDSLDLRQPLQLYLTSGDNLSSRIYTLKVNVHQQEGDSLLWNQCETEVPQLEGMTEMKAFVQDGRLMVLGQKDGDFSLAERSSTDATAAWNETTPTGLPLTADPQTLCQRDGTLYVSTADGQILSSSDAISWQQVGLSHTAPLTLIEKTDDFFYALSEGKLLRSADATTWQQDALDSEASLLPTADIRALGIQQAGGRERIVLVGQREDSDAGIVWNKTWSPGEAESEAQWMYFPLSPDNTVPCPKLAHLNLLPYDGNLIAFGGTSADGSRTALDRLYVSQDYGITWRHDGELHLPAGIKGAEGPIASTVDDNKFIWIITNAQVWRGRLNRLGFAQQ